MARKRALVVDDSKSARVILSRMLEKYDIEVDMAESAEQAIEYLKHNRPDAIFMDHLMPGMDGLQAVQAIKSNPHTAMIPIMMYTSQEGELYVGQARALGAMGVLPKQVRPVDVSKVLYELHLLPDRRDMAEPALMPVELVRGTAVERPAAAGMGDAKSSGSDWGRRIEATVKEQAGDVRRFIVASLDSFATRIVADVREAVSAPATEPVPPPSPAPLPVWPWAAAIAALVAIAATCAVFWQSTLGELRKSRAELAAIASANAELQHSRQDLTATMKDLTAALAALSPAAANGATSSRIEQVPYGEIPFDRGRIEALRDFLTKLEAQGFRGVVRITSAAGLFCLSGNSTDGFVPANAGLPVNKCDLVGNPFDDSLRGQQRQSLAFANLVSGVRQRSAGAISIVIENAGSLRPATPYPQHNDMLTAGEWNRAAASNNRVEFTADPST
ncbi:MAG: response regulator [Pseudomonadota bacterium]|nr:response regulator [Pseudomonadota bacterium]